MRDQSARRVIDQSSDFDVDVSGREGVLKEGYNVFIYYS
jgi:hypothetical protein